MRPIQVGTFCEVRGVLISAHDVSSHPESSSGTKKVPLKDHLAWDFRELYMYCTGTLGKCDGLLPTIVSAQHSHPMTGAKLRNILGICWNMEDV